MREEEAREGLDWEAVEKEEGMAVAARVERGRMRPGGLESVRNVSLWDQARLLYRVCLFWFSRVDRHASRAACSKAACPVG